MDPPNSFEQISANNTNLNVPVTALRDLHIRPLSAPTSRTSSPVSPEMIEQREAILRKAIQAIQMNESLPPAEKAKQIQLLMTSNWKASKTSLISQTNSEVFIEEEKDYNDWGRVQSPVNVGTEPNQRVQYHNEEKGILGCLHYQRGCQKKAECCQRWVTCRFCHDEVSDHHIDRYATKEMKCMYCDTIQPANQTCVKCAKILGHYFCSVCKFWDNDLSKEIFHCEQCRLCRIGKREDYFHCVKCNACISNNMIKGHKCIERNLESDCPICGEFMFTSVHPVIFMPCGHGLHEKCHRDHIKNSYQCPICCKSLADMTAYFRRLDKFLESHVMPDEYASWMSVILCNDCELKSNAAYHFLYHKCQSCGSYNTKVTDVIKPDQKGDASAMET